MTEIMARIRSATFTLGLTLVFATAIHSAAAHATEEKNERLRQEEEEAQAILDAIHAQMRGEEPPPPRPKRVWPKHESAEPMPLRQASATEQPPAILPYTPGPPPPASVPPPPPPAPTR